VSLGVNALVVLGLFLWGTRGLPKREVEVMVLSGEFAVESDASAGQTASQTEAVKLHAETPPEPTLEPINEPRQRAPRREAPAPLDGDQPSSGAAGKEDKPTQVIILPPPTATREARPEKNIAPPRSAIASRPPGGRVGSRSPSIIRANNRPPIWPPALSHIEATVLLELTISPQGYVTHVTVLRSSGYELFDAAAVNAARTWQGIPAIVDGQPVETIETQEAIFRFKR
jgi:protein TonB